MRYVACIAGGIGPDVWDEDIEISAADFMDAAKQADDIATERQAIVISINQYAK